MCKRVVLLLGSRCSCDPMTMEKFCLRSLSVRCLRLRVTLFINRYIYRYSRYINVCKRAHSIGYAARVDSYRIVDTPSTRTKATAAFVRSIAKKMMDVSNFDMHTTYLTRSLSISENKYTCYIMSV